MAYDSTNEILSSSPTGITLKEISRCIKDYRVDTNGRTDLGMMCTSPNIKKWAMYKPQRGGTYTSAPPLDEGFSGLIIESVADDDESMVDYFTNIDGDGDVIGTWEYPLPTIYRMSDFDGYYHKAQKPLDVEMRIIKGVANMSTAKLVVDSFPKVTGASENLGNINLHMLFGNNARLYLAYKYGSGSANLITVGNGYLDGADELRFEIPALDIELYGSLIAGLFIKGSDGKFYKLDDSFGPTYLEKYESEIYVSEQEFMGFSAYWEYVTGTVYTGDKTSIFSRLVLTNNTDSDISAKVNRIIVSYADGSEYSKTNVSITIPANQTVSVYPTDDIREVDGVMYGYANNLDGSSSAKLQAEVYNTAYPLVVYTLDDVDVTL